MTEKTHFEDEGRAFAEADARAQVEINAQETETPREAISSNHFSHDDQLRDAVGCLTAEESAAFYAAFPEWDGLTWEMSHVDTEASGVDVEYTSWATDWIEANTPIYWEDGEPWIPVGEL